MKHTVIDFSTLVESVRKDGRRHDYRIDSMEVYENYLHYRRRYINHAYHESVEYYLFPNENIGVYKLKQYDNIEIDSANTYKYYVDMVNVDKKPDQWIIKDLYIDFIIKHDNKYYVVDIDEFNEAINRNELSSADVSNALNGLDCVLKGYYSGFDIEKYIEKLVDKYKNNSILFTSAI
ncbi:MAG: hypothetical protein ACOZCL_02340 [Bacillota bacterium]